MLTVENVNEHFQESEDTVKGHMNQQRQGVCSTKPKNFEEPSASSEIGKKERDVYVKVVDLWNPRELFTQKKLEPSPPLPRVEQDGSWKW